MVGRRAPIPQVSGALATELLERDGGCGWCGESSDSSAASIEYRIPPPPKGADAVLGSDGLVAVCTSCQQTEKRSVRFPRGLLVAAAEVEEMGFSEVVRVALAEWLRSRQRHQSFQESRETLLSRVFDEPLIEALGDDEESFRRDVGVVPVSVAAKEMDKIWQERGFDTSDKEFLLETIWEQAQRIDEEQREIDASVREITSNIGKLTEILSKSYKKIALRGGLGKEGLA